MENFELFHVLNRGVDKRQIFMDKQDHYRFVHDLFEFNDKNPAAHSYYYNTPIDPQSSDIGCRKIKEKRDLLVHIHAFCMMPNHYHLLVSPVVEDGLPKFMKKLNMGYAKYFNKKYERSGALFQGCYKSVPIVSDSHFLFIPFYIHLNPLDLLFPKWRSGNVAKTQEALSFLDSYRWSSHLDFLEKNNFPSLTQREYFKEILGSPTQYTKKITEWISSDIVPPTELLLE